MAAKATVSENHVDLVQPNHVSYDQGHGLMDEMIITRDISYVTLSRILDNKQHASNFAVVL